MKVLDVIQKRRSIRKFKTDMEISQEQIDLILEAAMMAPSANNARPWEFIVVRDRDRICDISSIHPDISIAKEASLIIVICGLPIAGEESELYFPQDCAVATQNLLLQATELGLGSCWCGIYPQDEKVLGLSDVLGLVNIPFNVITIGVPDENPSARGFYEESKVRYM